MAKKQSAKDRYCIICGEHYEYCPVCRPADVYKPAWMNAYCSLMCHDVAEGLTRYHMNLLSLQQVQAELAVHDLASKKFLPEVQEDLDQVMKDYKVPAKEPEKKPEIKSEKETKATAAIKKPVEKRTENKNEKSVFKFHKPDQK